MKNPISIGSGRRVFPACGTSFRVAALVCVFTWIAGWGLAGPVLAQSENPEAASSHAETNFLGTAPVDATRLLGADPAKMSLEERLIQVEKTLNSIKTTGEKAEFRSYENKMMSRELIRYVKAMVVVLVLIAVGFPATILILTWKNVLGLSGLSSELAETLLAVEERQAKLATLLREIQVEMDYLNTQPSSDLGRLVQQAEKYVTQNEKDLEIAGFKRMPGQGK